MAETTVLFADIAGSTRIYEELGDEAGRALLTATLDLMADFVRKCGGRVRERIGDEILCTFPDPSVAAEAAGVLHTQMAIAHARGRLGRRVRIRIGFEHGPIVETQDGVFGNTVHTASRVSSLAKAEQTLTTRRTLRLLRPDLRFNCRPFERTVLKGQRMEQEIHELIWNRVTSSTFQMFPAPRRRKGGLGVELAYHGHCCLVDAGSPQVEIGRDHACDLRVEGSFVSHLHARIVWNHGKPWLEDLSTNGTVLEREGKPPVRLHHETVPLQGEGILALGVDEEQDARVSYRCRVSDT